MAGLTIKSMFTKPETFQYPFEEKEPIKGLKGHIVNDVNECILCGMCEKACPCHCIKVEKDSSKWEIDPFMCILCNSCVRVCPTKCLNMFTDSTPITVKKYITDMDVPKREKPQKSE